MFRKVNQAFVCASNKGHVTYPLVGGFDSLDWSDKLLFLLGKQTGSPLADMLIDRAVKKFLKRCFFRRSRFLDSVVIRNGSSF